MRCDYTGGRKKPMTECRRKREQIVKSSQAILIPFPPRRLPGPPSLRVGRRASPRVVIDRWRLVPQFGWRIRILEMVPRPLVLPHVVVVARRARSHGERVDRDRL